MCVEFEVEIEVEVEVEKVVQVEMAFLQRLSGMRHISRQPRLS